MAVVFFYNALSSLHFRREGYIWVRDFTYMIILQGTYDEDDDFDIVIKLEQSTKETCIFGSSASASRPKFGFSKIVEFYRVLNMVNILTPVLQLKMFSHSRKTKIEF